MTIPNDNRLRYLRDLASGARETCVGVERVEFVSILDELIRAREPARPPEFGWEGLAERLAKVEDGLGRSADPAWLADKLKGLDQRIDKVAEIIGERISGLIDRLDKLEKPWAYPPTEAIDAAFAALPPDAHGTIAPGEMERVLQAATRAAFPTGGAITAEAAADAVLPVPQRGDRVRLEGAKTLAFYSVPDGWYDVAGQNGDAFQIRVPQFGGDWLPYIPNANEGLKEVRHAENT